MSTISERRAPGTARIPFDAMVEVGGALGPSFETRAVNLSEEGMSLRTAYLPEVGQPVMCRFEAGYGLGVVAAGEVIWKEDMGNGGEFGIRFTNIDSQSTVALQRILGLAEEGNLPRAPQGRKVRLHIEGLASPMRARVKDQKDHSVTAYSELGFLQVGKPLELEDANSGSRRPAMIDGVAVEIDEVDRIPQLVVTLRYDDTDARNAMARMDNEIPVDEVQVKEQTPAPEAVEAPMPPVPAPAVVASAMPADEEEAAMDEESKKLKGAFARNAAKITPALTSWAKRAKMTIALLAAKAKRGGDDAEVPIRRTTAPAPGGGLHASGRKVIRGSIDDGMGLDEEPPKPKFKMTKKKGIAIGAIGVATILAFVALRKPAPTPQLAAAPPADGTSTSATAQRPAPAGANTNDPLAAMAQGGAYNPGAIAGKAQPFSNGPVGNHGNVIKIKMDGKIDRIEGASQPTGFTVVVPGRKSMDSAAPLASKDHRIAALRVANEQTGAELAVTFKDGVPNYQVRANGNVLELVLAKPSGHENAGAHAKKKPHKKH